LITNSGKGILSKYLVGQTSSYASHIAVGCGAAAIQSGPTSEFGDYSEKTSLDFEVARAPITSRGYQLIDGIENIVFTAQLPSAGQYDITEIGIFSAARNPSSSGSGSRTILSFTPEERWEIHESNASYAVPQIDYALDSFEFAINSVTQVASNTLDVSFSVPSSFPTSRTIRLGSRVRVSSPDSYNFSGFTVDFPTIPSPGTISSVRVSPSGPMPQFPYSSMNGKIYVEFNDGVFASQVENKAMFVSNNNSYFFPSGTRKAEKPRVSEFSLMTRGDSTLNDFGSTASNIYHLHLNNFSIDLGKNLPTDELRLALALTNTVDMPSMISNATFSIEFGTSESESVRQYARFSGSPAQLAEGHYVVSSQIQDLETTNNFSWKSVNTVRISAIIDGLMMVGDTSEELVTPGYIIFDSLRVEETPSTNPLYGMTGYSVVKTSSGNPIQKLSNTSTLVEFKFALSINDIGLGGTT
jgi:hypothetical protein